MKNKIWMPLQIALLVLVMFTTYNSILALNSGDRYCSGLYCESNNDCGLPCYCAASDHTCYNPYEAKI
jgi:hypothetical protein